jgi:hypothetical protein
MLSIQESSDITLRGFTVNGSDGELPEEEGQCGEKKRIAEHMHGVYVLNSTDVTIDRMNIIKAHGDGLNLKRRYFNRGRSLGIGYIGVCL